MFRPFFYLAEHAESGRELFSSNDEARRWVEYQASYHQPDATTRWVDGGEHGWQALRLGDGTSVGHVYAMQVDKHLPDPLDDED